jgi:hypothetical protein
MNDSFDELGSLELRRRIVPPLELVARVNRSPSVSGGTEPVPSSGSAGVIGSALGTETDMEIGLLSAESSA